MTTQTEIKERKEEINKIKIASKNLYLNNKTTLTEIKENLKQYHLRLKPKEINNFLFNLLIEKEKKSKEILK